MLSFSTKTAKTARSVLVLLLATLLTACASSSKVVDESDPYEGVNRNMYSLNDTLDRSMFKPLAKGYVWITPNEVRTGVTNFFDNLSYLNVVLNSLLQGKLQQGSQDAARFLVNSSVGIGGLFDPATSMGLPKHDEDLGQTLAVWGIGQGVYLNLPLLGPNTARNTTDYASGTLTNPLYYLGGVALLPIGVLHTINTRANLIDASETLDEVALDPYAFTRGAYLQRREYLIFDGAPPVDDFDALLEEEYDGETENGVLEIE